MLSSVIPAPETLGWDPEKPASHAPLFDKVGNCFTILPGKGDESGEISY